MTCWVTEAWRRDGSRGALWYATRTPEFYDQWDELHQRLDIWFDDVRPPVTPLPDLAAQVVCDEELRDLKHRVLRAHASQTAALEEMLGSEVYRDWWSTESFVAATPGTASE